jgi:hypothetical protein
MPIILRTLLEAADLSLKVVLFWNKKCGTMAVASWKDLEGSTPFVALLATNLTFVAMKTKNAVHEALPTECARLCNPNEPYANPLATTSPYFVNLVVHDCAKVPPSTGSIQHRATVSLSLHVGLQVGG